MKQNYSQSLFMGMLMLCIMLFPFQQTTAQESDQPTPSPASNGALQFQVMGGIGVYYIGTVNNNPAYRIGADLSFNQSDKSGSQEQGSFNTPAPPSTTSWYNNAQKPEQNERSYEVKLSALYLHTVASYNRASIYCGIGPMTDYAWSRGTGTSTTIQSSSYTSPNSTYNTASENTQKTTGLGGLAIAGVKARLMDGVELSAELGISALYEWTFSSNSYSETNITVPASPIIYGSNNNNHLAGWDISINNIRIGFIIEL